VEGAFGLDVDYAVLHKIYGAPADDEARRYFPGKCLGWDRKTVISKPEDVSTSFAERQNLTVRMSMRRFIRLANAFSEKFDNHRCIGRALFMYFDFCWVHHTIRETPAMGAGLADHIWTVEEMVAPLEPIPDAN
jgi:hypothetical protein